MNKKEIYLSFILLAVAFVILLTTLYPYRPHNFVFNPPTVTTIPSITPTPSASPVIILTPNLSFPLKSPQKVIGLVDRSWVFEASFPFQLFDNQFRILYQGTASAPNWLEKDSEYTNFTANINFLTKSPSGYILITNDNPSGISENNKSITIPVIFNTSETIK